MTLLCGWFWFCAGPVSAFENGYLLQQLSEMKDATLMVAGNQTPPLTIDPDQPMIPASTLKVLTALLAIQTWGEEHRFVTDFTLDNTDRLWIKGYGDPFLISEEIDLIVEKIIAKGLIRINGIGIDDSFFAPIKIHGQSATDNPYDAPLNALAANFNTINVRIDKSGIHSAEIQTPVTPLMIQKARGLPAGTHRINIGLQQQSSRYFAEILLAKLKKQGIEINDQIIFGTFPDTRLPYYRHQNSRTLSTMIAAMLQYSNNFIANQLFLLFGVEKSGSPASIEKAQSAVLETINDQFMWSNYAILEGAGLSRKNRLSARQLIEILRKFAPYKKLLSFQNQDILAKSGTLKGISTYAGYLNRSGHWQPFALMINGNVDSHFRKQLMIELLKYDDKNDLLPNQ